MNQRPSTRLVRALLAALAISAAMWIATAILWLRSEQRAASVAELDSAARQELVAELLEQSPGVFQWAWFAPEIGYTLTPNAALDAWGSTFRSNALGYRTHAAEKPEDVYRVLFLGDSWTFGMGVEQHESYPEAFARLANERKVAQRYGRVSVQAWTLALPGYNTFNFTGAFWHHFATLQPDAVVVGISANDNHSTHAILPNGSATKSVVQPDLFGEPHPTIYSARSIDSFRYAERWRISFTLLRELEERLERLQVPINFFFVGRTREVPMHARVAEAGLTAPYVVVPLERTKGAYSNASWGHGTPAANELYGAYVYANLAQTLGWPPLTETPAGYQRHTPPVTPPGEPTTLAAHEAASRWWQLYAQEAAESSADLFPPGFRPGKPARVQSLGDFAARTGLLGRAATLLVRRPVLDADQLLRLRYRTLEDAPELYPIDLTVTVPGEAAAQRSVVRIEEGSSGWLELLLPPSHYSIVDLQLVASRTAGPNGQRPAASLVVEEVTFER